MAQMFSANPVYTVLWILAVPSSVILVLQTILLLFGLGGHEDADLDSDVSGIDFDTDHDFDVEVDHDHDFILDHDHDYDHDDGAMHSSGLRLFTVRGMVAFFAVGAWSGISAISLGAPNWLALLVTFIFGSLALLFVALFLKWSLKLQHDGTMKPSQATGKEGEVYITIGANRSTRGKVNIILQQQLVELDAVTDADRPLKYGERVKIVETLGDNTLVVEPIQ